MVVSTIDNPLVLVYDCLQKFTGGCQLVWNQSPPANPTLAVPSTFTIPQQIANNPLRVAIGIPYTTGFTALFAMKTFGPLLFTPVPFCDKTPKMCRGVPLNVARDQIVTMALEDPKCTHILWVDTDMVCENPPDPNAALQVLLNINAPIAGALYRAKQETGFNYAAWKMTSDQTTGKLGFVPIQSFTGNWIEVDVTGLGFCLVKREVYEKVPRPWHPWNTPGPSEDFAFFMAARNQGYKVMIMTDVKLSHIGDLQVHCADGKVTTLEV